MTPYEQKVWQELKTWQKQMQRSPSLVNRITTSAQYKLNRLLPEKLHRAITATIKQMVRIVLFGAKLTTKKPIKKDFELCEAVVQERINFYKKTAAAEGGVTGAGGILLGLVDFPVLLGLKLKMLYDICAIYGYNVEDYRERIYILYIFQLAFSSQERRNKVYRQMVNWEEQRKHLPDDIHQFDWRAFQQEYRDYIDLAKLAQLIPVIGAPVGFIANYQLIKKLGHVAMNAYRMRRFDSHKNLIGPQAPPPGNEAPDI